ncbi:MAG: phosphate ABC transporter permease PstA [Verrucomicrobiae bacterium]|nr:phosphate ABC transporter permease PstA [Verrucomicrobiae bacterium]
MSALPYRQRRTSLTARGEPMVWLTGAGLAVATLMISGLLLLVILNGTATFWPKPLRLVTLANGQQFLGEATRYETLVREGVLVERVLLRTGNFDLYGDDFKWVNLRDLQRVEYPLDAWLFERQEWGPFIGYIRAVRIDGVPVTLEQFETLRRDARQRFRQIRHLEKHVIGGINARLEALRLQQRRAELQSKTLDISDKRAALEAKYNEVTAQLTALRREDQRFTVLLAEAGGRTKELRLSEIVRAYPANRLTTTQQARVYLSRWWEFLTSEPREANTEGGVLPAIFGTVLMTLIMSVAVAPFGVIAALYLREYARQGPLLSAVRIAVNNLAGVPSIVFGVFGLGFFCYVVGGTIDSLLYPEKLPTPTFGTGGILWASLTLALLTVPVVIVATEEALAAVPRSMREGSYACGASKWQTIWRIVLPRAMPGVMTGLILAMARGAGEVAPLMITGVVKLAPELPIDGNPPFFHLSRSFMHLGFHIYDVGFQSRNSEAGKPMVYTTTLLLILLIALLNISAIYIRNRLRRRFVGAQF